jgi:NADH-quinone oxidoreductase subunit K
MLNIFDFMNLSLILYGVGIWGLLVARTNFVVILLSLEIILLAVNVNFISYSIYLDDLLGHIYALIILAVAASESAIGLALLIVYYRARGIITIDAVPSLKG